MYCVIDIVSWYKVGLKTIHIAMGTQCMFFNQLLRHQFLQIVEPLHTTLSLPRKLFSAQ